MAEPESLVLGVERTPIVQDRTEVQLSDGAQGDWGDTRDP
jgi:hypothetical protein